MRRVIFLFLDGVGLGSDDPAVNPLAAGHFPTLIRLLDGKRPVLDSGRLATPHADWIPTDANLGILGRPQSATGQTAILTGLNAPQRLGEHYGPRPDQRVRDLLDEASLFRRINKAGRSAWYCNAYPHRYFKLIESGRRLLSAVPYAATVGGQTLLNHADLQDKRALAADFTNRGWRTELGYDDIPVFEPAEAGRLLWELAQPHDFIFFEHWYTDLLGHRGKLTEAVEVLTVFDAFLGGLMDAADLAETLIIMSSDHGNVEDCSHGKHTNNPVPTLLIGDDRAKYAAQIQNLTDFAPAILDYLSVDSLK